MHQLNPNYGTVFPPVASILKLNIYKEIISGHGDKFRYSSSDIVVILDPLSISECVSIPLNLIVDMLSFPIR